MTEATDTFFEHNGVKGMKWGVHRSKSGGSSKPPVHEDAAKANELRIKVKKGGTKALSNKDLEDLNKRLNLEQQYTKLNPKKSSAGQKLVAGVLRDSGKELAKEYVKSGAKAGISALLAPTPPKTAGALTTGK